MQACLVSWGTQTKDVGSFIAYGAKRNHMWLIYIKPDHLYHSDVTCRGQYQNSNNSFQNRRRQLFMTNPYFMIQETHCSRDARLVA